MAVTDIITTALLCIAATIVGVMSTARLTRLITTDTWPPVVWLRIKVASFAESRGLDEWGDIVTCPYCAAPWLTFPVLAWAIWSDLHWTWWIFNGWLAVAYAAAMIVARDGD